MTFTVMGDPIGKPRQTQQDKWMKRPNVMRYRAWETQAQLVARGRQPSDPKVVEVRAYIRIPGSWSQKKKEQMAGQFHRQKPDADNILKSCCDALFKDDSMIYHKVITKYWDDGKGPRVEIEVQ